MANNGVRLADVARRAGVSMATVSNALTGRGRVSPERAAEIRAIATAMGYRPSHAARTLRMGRSSLIGLVLPNITNPIFPSLAQAIEAAAFARGCGVLLLDCHEDPRRQEAAFDHLVQLGADSLIVIPLRGTTVPTGRQPVVVIDSALAPRNGISSDHRAGGQLMAEHLLGLGHRNMVLLAGPAESNVARLRHQGMRDVFDAAGGTSAREIHGAYGIEAGERAVADLDLAGATAIAAISDTLAIGAMRAAARRGLSIPGDVAVAGFDGTVWAELVSPALTTIQQDVAAIARGAISIALDQAKTGQLVPVRLVARASTTGASETTPQTKEN